MLPSGALIPEKQHIPSSASVVGVPQYASVSQAGGKPASSSHTPGGCTCTPTAKCPCTQGGSLKLQIWRWGVWGGWCAPPVTGAPIVSAFHCAVVELMTPLNSSAVWLSFALPYCPGHLTCGGEGRRGVCEKGKSLPAPWESSLSAFWGAPDVSELAQPIFRRDQTQIKPSLGAAPRVPAPVVMARLGSRYQVCACFSLWEMTVPQWKDTSALIKLSFYCLSFVFVFWQSPLLPEHCVPWNIFHFCTARPARVFGGFLLVLPEANTTAQ